MGCHPPQKIELSYIVVFWYCTFMVLLIICGSIAMERFYHPISSPWSSAPSRGGGAVPHLAKHASIFADDSRRGDTRDGQLFVAWHAYSQRLCQFRYPLVMANIAMENGPFIDDLPIKTSIYQGFSMAMLNNQMVDYPEMSYWKAPCAWGTVFFLSFKIESCECTMW